MSCARLTAAASPHSSALRLRGLRNAWGALPNHRADPLLAERLAASGWEGRSCVRDFASAVRRRTGGKMEMEMEMEMASKEESVLGKRTRASVATERLASSAPAASSAARSLPPDMVHQDWVELPSVKEISSYEPAGTEVLGIDIGGTLAKFVHLERVPRHAPCAEQHGEQLVCGTWPTKKTTRFFAGVQAHVQLRFDLSNPRHGLSLCVTGGGAMKYSHEFQHIATGLNLVGDATMSDDSGYNRLDEMTCLAAGLQFLLRHIPDGLYSFDSSDTYPVRKEMEIPASSDSRSRCRPVEIERGENELHPMLLANIGTGVSFVLCPTQRVQQDDLVKIQPAKRVGGTPMSGSTLFGLLKVLTKNPDLTYKGMLELASKGDSRKVDMTVQDVYGDAYMNVGLVGERAAGFLGKAATGQDESQYAIEDVARSLVFAIGYNIGQQAVLQARLNDAAKEICFTGSFAGGHPLTMGAIDYAVTVNGGGEYQATFLKHDRYLGAIGAWAMGAAGGKMTEAAEAP